MQQGIRPALTKAMKYIGARLRRHASGEVIRPKPAVAEECLGLSPGEWVEVKSEPEILATLDAKGKCRGLLFTEDMHPHFGRRFRVLKRVETIYLEESRQNRTLRNTVILEGVHCPGAAFACDRYCYLFWREAWLRRVADVLSSPAS